LNLFFSAFAKDSDSLVAGVKFRMDLAIEFPALLLPIKLAKDGRRLPERVPSLLQVGIVKSVFLPAFACELNPATLPGFVCDLSVVHFVRLFQLLDRRGDFGPGEVTEMHSVLNRGFIVPTDFVISFT
jgi:hypothetical protein